MCETVQKSDHRPVTCEFVLQPTPQLRWLGETARRPLQLTIAGLRLFDQEDIESARICCPLPCEDAAWDRRWVALRGGRHG